jgi:hypothetical protein
MIWENCQGTHHIQPIAGTLFRLVESQEQIATMGYVDTLEEQALLEEMLENIKPTYPTESEHYHYLLKTPFRYPPLKWGSRFGRTHEPSIFYGGGNINATLAESAYYRFLFWFSMNGEPVKDKIRTEHTLFSVGYQSNQGISLQNPPFVNYVAELAHRQNYSPCQQLGSAMREAEVEGFEYLSARDPLKGICIGLFTPRAFAQKKPLEMNQWLCEMSARDVSFKQLGNRTIYSFALDNFLVDGELPYPA